MWTRWSGSSGTWARLWPGRWERWLCRQLLVLGDAAAVGVLVGGLLVEGGEGDDGDNNFDAMAPLGLQLCFNLLAPTATCLRGAGALESVSRDLGALFRQLLGRGGCDGAGWGVTR